MRILTLRFHFIHSHSVERYCYGLVALPLALRIFTLVNQLILQLIVVAVAANGHWLLVTGLVPPPPAGWSFNLSAG